jgi:hypothetical protein
MNTPNPAPTGQGSNNAGTYAAGLIAAGIFYALGKYGITLPAGGEAEVAAFFAAVIGQVAGKIKIPGLS